jgi:hypothetical protein
MEGYVPQHYDGHTDRSVSLAHREAVRVAFEEPRLLSIVLSKITTAAYIPAGSDMKTPCCLWEGKHSRVGDPTALVARASTHGVNVSRIVWMRYYNAELPPDWFVYRTCGNRRCLAPNHMAASAPAAHSVRRMRSLGVFEGAVENGVLVRVLKNDGLWHDVAIPKTVASRRLALPEDQFVLSDWVDQVVKGEDLQELSDDAKRETEAFVASMVHSAVTEKEEGGGMYAIANAIAHLTPKQLDYGISRLWSLTPKNAFKYLHRMFESGDAMPQPVVSVESSVTSDYLGAFNTLGKKCVGYLIRAVKACWKYSMFSHVSGPGHRDVVLSVHECYRRYNEGQRPFVYAMEKMGVLREYRNSVAKRHRSLYAAGCL